MKDKINEFNKLIKTLFQDSCEIRLLVNITGRQRQKLREKMNDLDDSMNKRSSLSKERLLTTIGTTQSSQRRLITRRSTRNSETLEAEARRSSNMFSYRVRSFLKL